MAEAMRANVAELLKGIDRYNPENLGTLERYVEMQARENHYDLEANLGVLKLYQFNQMFFQPSITAQVLLKALTNLPHTDFNLCKCLIDVPHLEEEPLSKIMELHVLLETCQFTKFWNIISHFPEITAGVAGFEDSIRKFVCHVVGATYQIIDFNVLQQLLGTSSEYVSRQWINKYGWQERSNGEVFIANQEANIKTKNITEKITFESVAALMATTPSLVR